MALVLDPRTGQMVDDGRPAATPQRSLTSPGATAASLASMAFGGSANPQQLPSYGQPTKSPVRPQVPAALQQAETYIQNNPTLAALASPVAAAGRGVEAVTGASPTELAQSVGRVGLGALALPVTAAVEGVRNSAVSALGGDVASLPGGGSAQSDAASALIARGSREMGSAARNAVSNVGTGVQDFALGLLGAQRAQPLPTAPRAATTPSFAPGTIGAGGITPADQAVIAQDRANLQSAVDRLNTNFDTWRVPEPTARTGQGGGAGGALMAADTVPTRGNYTQYNTNLDALRQRSMGGNGIDLGASALAAQPAAPRTGLNVVGLSRSAEDMMTSDDPFTRAAGRERLRAETALAQQGLANAGELARTQTAGQFGLQEANLRGQFGLQGADVQGQYGLAERELTNAGQVEAARQSGLASLAAAEARAAGTVQAAQLRQSANAGTDALRQQEAFAQQMLNAQMLDALSRNDMATYNQLALGRFAPQQGGYTDPLSGAPLSPAEIAALQQANLARLNR